jgi:NitT/TauT family transport system substrate-binding protein
MTLHSNISSPLGKRGFGLRVLVCVGRGRLPSASRMVWLEHARFRSTALGNAIKSAGGILRKGIAETAHFGLADLVKSRVRGEMLKHLQISRSLHCAVKSAAGTLAVAAVAFGGCSGARADEQVRLALNWLVSGRNAGYFLALEKGFYKDEGLTVSISRGNGSADTIKRVAAGESEFGLADAASVIGAIGNDSSPVKIVGMMYSKSSVAVLFTENAGIKTPKDLVGRKIARSAAGASPAMFPGFLKANNIDGNTLEEVVAGASSFIPLLLGRKVDAVVDQTSYLGRYNKVGATAGLSFGAFRFADYGLDLYGDAIFVSNGMIEKEPETIRKFMTATLKGNRYAFDHPEEAIEILRKTNPEVDTDVGLKELLDTRDLALTDEVAAHGYGYIDPVRMTKTISIVNDYIGLRKPVRENDVYTLNFIDTK